METNRGSRFEISETTAVDDLNNVSQTSFTITVRPRAYSSKSIDNLNLLDMEALRDMLNRFLEDKGLDSNTTL